MTYNNDRRGRLAQVVRSGITTTVTYNDANQLLGEIYSGGTLGGLIVTNLYDSFLRRTEVASKNGSTQLAATDYAYDTASRLQTVTAGVNSAAYSYLANSPLISQITFKSNTIVRMTTTKTYGYLNRLGQISSVPSASSTVNYSYLYNSANQRTERREADSSFWLYQYDRLGQVISGKKYWSDWTPVAGQQFQYVADDIGNRTPTKAGGDSTGANLRSATYSANSLNQYTQRDVPGGIDIIGIANSSATATVNGQNTYRKVEYYQKALAIVNTSTNVWQPVTNQAVLTGTTNTTIGNVYLPKTPEAVGYDADGNETSDGRWTLTWDAENRPITMLSSNVVDGAKKKLDFVYDWRGRRRSKILSTWNGSAFNPASTNRFVYDDWNLLAEVGATNNLIRSYVSGLDLSGTMQGAGGVGGLVAVSIVTNGIHFAAYDGNGNASALVSGTNGSTSAQYEYGAFGELIRSSGTAALANPFRFSTKFTDDDPDFLYYGYRYYNPSTGKFLSRDPIQERGGPNLYAFLGNRVPNAIDWLGLCKLGNKRKPKCEISITDSGNDPSRIAAAKGLVELAGETEQFARLMALAESAAAGGILGATEAITTAADKLAEEQGRPDAKDLAKRAIDLVKSLGAWRGYTPFTRINYQGCACGSLSTLYRNYWKDQSDNWERFDGASDLGLGTFLDALKAIESGSKRCKVKLKQWNEANKGILEE